jgi:putative SOS response-associated peptidase YedK
LEWIRDFLLTTIIISESEEDMCFHISLAKDRRTIERRFDASFIDPILDKIYHASAFTFPKIPVISNDDSAHIQLFNWGLIPFWVKDESTARKIRGQTLNAKAETITKKTSFRHPIKNRRCLVLADGFYEWQHIKNRRYPYYIYLKDHQLFAFAGIWDIWTNKETQETLKTFSIITTQANSLLAEIHNTKRRMPVILRPEEERRWLSDISLDEVLSLLVPHDEKAMEAHTVSRLITTRGILTNVPEVMSPYQYEAGN